MNNTERDKKRREGAAKGGKARARNLSERELHKISVKGNKARWKTPEQHKAHSEALKAAHARRRANAAKAGSQE